MNSGSPLIRAISLAMITFLLLTACGADQPTEEAGQTTEAGVDGPVLRHLASRAAGGEDAEVAGTLALEDDCLYLQSEDHTERYPIVWPNRTRWDSDRQVVLLPNGDQVGIDDQVYGGGGYHDVAGVEVAAGPDAAALADSCLDNAYGEVAIVNNQDDGIQRTDSPDAPAEETTDIEENEGAQPEQSTGVTVERGKSVGEIQTEPGPGEVKLWVSNQSFDDDPIHLTVTIGDVTVVEEHFEVEGQHNWIAFDIKGLEPGSHTIVAESDTGATLTVDFTVVADEPRWLVLDYWYYPEDAEGRYFTFDESDQPVGFA